MWGQGLGLKVWGVGRGALGVVCGVCGGGVGSWSEVKGFGCGAWGWGLEFRVQGSWRRV